MKTNEWVKWDKTFEELVYFIGEMEGPGGALRRWRLKTIAVIKSGDELFLINGRSANWSGMGTETMFYEREAIDDSAIVDEYMVIT